LNSARIHWIRGKALSQRFHKNQFIGQVTAAASQAENGCNSSDQPRRRGESILELPQVLSASRQWWLLQVATPYE
jgi:hypothetical protein